MVETYQVVVDPTQLQRYQISLGDVTAAIRNANSEVGGSVIEMAEAEYMVRGFGYLQSIEDFQRLPIAQLPQMMVLLP